MTAFSDDEQQRMRELLEDEGMTVYEVAAELGRDRSTIVKRAKRHGISYNRHFARGDTGHAPVIDQRSSAQWRYRAACKNIDPAIFFPPINEDAGRPPGPAQLDKCAPALAVCAGCHVRIECLEEELLYDTGQQYGIRGGTTAWERRNIIHRRANDGHTRTTSRKQAA